MYLHNLNKNGHVYPTISTSKTPIGYNTAKRLTLIVCVFFLLQKYRHCILVKKVLPKHSTVIFGLVYPPEKYKKWIVVYTFPFLFKICKYKSWNIFKVKLQGSKVKRITSYIYSTNVKLSKAISTFMLSYVAKLEDEKLSGTSTEKKSTKFVHFTAKPYLNVF